MQLDVTYGFGVELEIQEIFTSFDFQYFLTLDLFKLNGVKHIKAV